MTDLPLLRLARTDDFAALESIERRADDLLIELFDAQDWPEVTSAADRAGYPGFSLVAEFTGVGAVGFVQVLETEGTAHLEQLSVVPAHGRRGIGRILVCEALSEAAQRGHETITLRTYRDAPWNAPFYASCGFSPSVPATDFQRRLADIEDHLGLERWGPRLQMTATLSVP